jgi:hypothetical protein
MSHAPAVTAVNITAPIVTDRTVVFFMRYFPLFFFGYCGACDPVIRKSQFKSQFSSLSSEQQKDLLLVPLS